MILAGPSHPEFLREETLFSLLQQTAGLYPERIAFESDLHRISYAELVQRAQRLGESLCALGARPNQIIGLLLPRGGALIEALVGITASGAAWLPFDAEIPRERAASCLQAAQAIGLLSTRSLASSLETFPFPVWYLEDLLAPDAPRQEILPSRPEHLAYVIYTSGSTGAPKGISISHANICHLLRSENAILGIRPEDHVYQGFSAAFDMSLEEIWISFLVGASLWIAPQEIVSDPEAISEALRRHRVTVLHAVPTLAALLPDLPPSLRLLNLGGEACPDALAQRLVGQGRRVFNTYGPTETTVTASVLELEPHQPVTIGKPLPNYGMCIVPALRPEGPPSFEALQPLPINEIGEIAIFGPGVSQGYLNQPELTAARFPPNPLPDAPANSRLYLTGDLGRITPDGQIHCLGRVDNQIKLRGFRIELDEIAAALSRQPGVSTAAAVIRELRGTEEIVAFALATSSSAPTDSQTLRRALQRALPAYMVPARIEMLEAMPRLVSGKIDLHALKRRPLTELPAPTLAEATFQPETTEQSVLWKALEVLFPGQSFQPHQDFFEDLGGHSLLAARLVTLLRRSPSFSQVSVQLVYRERRLGSIAQALTNLAAPSLGPAEEATPIPWRRRFLCGLAQALCVPLLLLFHLLQWLAPFFTYHYFTGALADSIPRAAAASIGVFLLNAFLAFPLSIGLRRLLTGRFKPGKYPLWGGTYFRWWLAERLSGFCASHLISGTPWKALHLRLLGARIGRHTLINSLSVSIPELLEVGDGACVGTFVTVENARVENGLLWIGKVRIGARATVDSYAVLEEDTSVGEGAHLGGQSSLGHGRSIPPGASWAGAPAQPVASTQTPWTPAPPPHRLQLAASMLFYLLGGAAIAALFFIPSFPCIMLIDWIDAHTLDLFESTLAWWQTFPLFFAMAIPASMALVLLTGLLAALLRKGFPRQTPGRFSVYSLRYHAKWFLSTIFDTSLEVLHGLYASVFVGTWLRLMGAQVGKGSEVSTAAGMTPEILELGEDCFIADGVLLGDEEQHDGWIELKGTRIGNRSFVGNGAYVPDNAQLPPDILIGVQSATPPNSVMAPHQTWMGSPPLLLPARETLVLPDASLTFHPTLLRRLVRGAIEALRIVLPMAYTISAGYVLVYLAMPSAEAGLWGSFLLKLLPGVVLFALGSLSLVCLLKWTLIGRYRPRKAPMWTPFVWVSEAVTVAYESLAVPHFLDLLRGTPFLPWTLRLLGAHIGRGTWLNTTDLTEFDCVRIGDFAELNAHCGPQTHLFEDRIMRIGTVDIGPGTTLGARTTVLYDTALGAHCRLGPLTLVAKGEVLPPHTRWEGSPAAMPLPANP